MQSKPFSDWVKSEGIGNAADRLSQPSLTVTYQMIQYWVRVGIPPKHVLRVSEVSGLPAHQLRADIYPAEVARASNA